MDKKQSLSVLRDILLGNPVETGANLNHLNCDCSFCGKEEKFYINYERAFKKVKDVYVGCWDCKSCGQTGSLPKLLKQIGRLDLIQDDFKSVNVYEPLGRVQVKMLSHKIKEEEVDLSTPDKELPFGFTKIKKHPYLVGRGYSSKDYSHFDIGYCKGSRKYKGYVMFPIVEDGIIKGFLSRSTKSKDDVNAINAKYKEDGLKHRYLRWKNSFDTDFSKLLYGLTNTTDKIDTVILVEGPTDVHNVTRLLKLYKGNIRCFGTFGKKLSVYQVRKLKNLGVKNLIFMFDPDAVNEIKRYSTQEMRNFNVKAVSLGDKDPGDLDYEELKYRLENSMNPVMFSLIKVQKIKSNDKPKARRIEKDKKHLVLRTINSSPERVRMFRD